MELKKEKSALQCFLFDSTCIHPPGHSIYEKLAPPHRLAITVIDLGRSPMALTMESCFSTIRTSHQSDGQCREISGARKTAAGRSPLGHSRWSTASGNRLIRCSTVKPADSVGKEAESSVRPCKVGLTNTGAAIFDLPFRQVCEIIAGFSGPGRIP